MLNSYSNSRSFFRVIAVQPVLGGHVQIKAYAKWT